MDTLLGIGAILFVYGQDYVVANDEQFGVLITDEGQEVTARKYALVNVEGSAGYVSG